MPDACNEEVADEKFAARNFDAIADAADASGGTLEGLEASGASWALRVLAAGTGGRAARAAAVTMCCDDEPFAHAPDDTLRLLVAPEGRLPPVMRPPFVSLCPLDWPLLLGVPKEPPSLRQAGPN